MINDDNEPAPENVPNNNSNANIQFFKWGMNGNICNWMQTGATKGVSTDFELFARGMAHITSVVQTSLSQVFCY